MASASILPFPPRKQPSAQRRTRLDLDDLLAVQQANLAAAREAQSVLASTAHAVAEAQFACFEQILLDMKAALMGNPTPEAVLANITLPAERSAALASEVLELAMRAQRRLRELMAEQMRAGGDKLVEGLGLHPKAETRN